MLRKYNADREKIIGKINNHDVKLAKVKGEFVWHNHKNEDELFFIIKERKFIDFATRKNLISHKKNLR